MKIKQSLLILSIIFISLMVIGSASASDNATDVIETADVDEVQAIEDVDEDIDEVLTENIEEDDDAVISAQDVQNDDDIAVDEDAKLTADANAEVIADGETQTSDIDVEVDGVNVTNFKYTHKNGTYSFSELLEILDLSKVDMSTFGNFAEMFKLFGDLKVNDNASKAFDFRIDGDVSQAKYNLAFLSNLTDINFDYKLSHPNGNPIVILGKVIKIYSDGKLIKTLSFSSQAPSNFDFANFMNMGELSGLDMSSFKDYMSLAGLFNDTNSSKSFSFKISGEIGKLKYDLLMAKNGTDFIFDYKIYRPAVAVIMTASPVSTSTINTKVDGKTGKYLTITLKDVWGRPVSSKLVQISINGKVYKVFTNANGVAKYQINFAKAGTYYASICFLGDEVYPAAFKVVKITVTKQKTTMKTNKNKYTFKAKAKTKIVKVTLKNAKKKALSGKKITLKIKGKTFTAKTNKKGLAAIKVKFTKKGKYTITAKFAGDNTYKAISKKVKVILK